MRSSWSIYRSTLWSRAPNSGTTLQRVLIEASRLSETILTVKRYVELQLNILIELSCQLLSFASIGPESWFPTLLPLITQTPESLATTLSLFPLLDCDGFSGAESEQRHAGRHQEAVNQRNVHTSLFNPASLVLRGQPSTRCCGYMFFADLRSLSLPFVLGCNKNSSPQDESCFRARFFGTDWLYPRTSPTS